MRYFWAFLMSVGVIVVGASSCSSGKSGGGPNGGSETGGAGGSASTTGSGGQTGIMFGGDSGVSTGDGGGCAAYRDCAAQNLACGMAGDGCGNILDCGSCAAGQTCTAGACVAGSCTPATCASAGFNCGVGSDGCGGLTANCGSCAGGQVCGANGMPNVCGVGACQTTTCSALGYTCGSWSDGCNGTLNCGSCASNEACNGGTCKTVCTPTTCTALGASCGVQSDGCSGVLNCGTCGANQICNGLTCGNSATCTGYCLAQTTCPGTATTSISGTVFAPNGTDPLPGALVYVPNGPLQAFPAGVSCGSCTSEVSGDPLVSTISDFDGSFKLTNMPVGTNIPIVIQKGRWRREYFIPNVASCVNTTIPSTPGATQLRMPTKEAEFTQWDNIPLMAFVTGSVDALECVLRKIGIADGQFSNPGGTGRVRFYQGAGSAGAKYNASTPSETTLWGTQAAVNAYDMVYFACQGGEYQQTAAAQQVMVNYANAGGRIFATHYSYVWLTNSNDNAAWQGTATWVADPIWLNEGVFATDPGVGLINTASSDPRPTTLAKWLQFIKASTTYGQMSVKTLRNDFTAVTSPALLWISDNDNASGGLGNEPLHYTFDTPWGSPPANQCGRVLYSDFHVEDASTAGTTFPKECTSTTMTPQEKMLEFMLFDLGSCVTPPTCTPKTCASQGATCGEVGDGCTSTPLMCGTCPSGQNCVGGKCANNGCTPLTCADQGYSCGTQGDGCGNTINCGSCPSGQSCGGAGTGKCGNGSCTPMTTCPAGMCGTMGDGCGNTINCNPCPSGESCNAGKCTMSGCMPKTCSQLGYNCGAAADGCGNIIQCGTCAGNQTCGGSGSANVCGGGA